MSRTLVFGALAMAVLSVSGAGAQTPAPEAAPSAAVIAPPAPALKEGGMVSDRTGAPLGPIQSLVDAPRGPMVVIKIDGKLVSVPQSTLTLKGANAISSQTKAEILAAAQAPP
jgi:hypothetical protein